MSELGRKKAFRHSRPCLVRQESGTVGTNCFSLAAGGAEGRGEDAGLLARGGDARGIIIERAAYPRRPLSITTLQ
jgi:hypothetical protein